MVRIDALTAEQDIARGVQLGLLFGRSLDVLATPDDDIFLAADLYIGAGSGHKACKVEERLFELSRDVPHVQRVLPHDAGGAADQQPLTAVHGRDGRA